MPPSNITYDGGGGDGGGFTTPSSLRSLRVEALILEIGDSAPARERTRPSEDNDRPVLYANARGGSLRFREDHYGVVRAAGPGFGNYAHENGPRLAKTLPLFAQ